MEVIEVQIQRLVAGGVGLARWQGMAVMVPFVAPGDVVEVEIRQKGNRFLRGEIRTILQAGAGRCEPVCPHYGQCGGCDMQHLSPDVALHSKRDILVDALARIGGVRDEHVVSSPLAAQSIWSYRRRAGIKVRKVGERVVLGFFQRQSHRVVDLDHCPALHPSLNGLITQLRQVVASMGCGDKIPQIDGVSGQEGCGLIFHLLEPLSAADRQRLLGFAREQGLRQLWLQQGRKSGLTPLWQAGELSWPLPPYGLEFHPADFVQAHFEQNCLLVAKAMGHCPGGEVALDLFCGVGNFSLPLAEQFGRVVGVEGYEPALQRARKNASRYHGEKITFQAMDLSREGSLSSLAQVGASTVVLDPPREGAVQVARWLAKGEIDSVVYVSCDPASLARDAAILIHGGYRLQQATPVDMFPQTHHVETVACFSRTPQWSN